jgi:hypothetical protein
LNCLFYLRAPHSTLKSNVFVPPGERRELTEDNCSYISTGKSIILQSFLVEQYLQVESEEDPEGALQESEASGSVDSFGEARQRAKKRKVIASEYLKKARNQMIFVIEEIEPE